MTERYLFLTTFLLLFASQLKAQINVDDTLQYQNLDRRYVVHLPPAYDPGQSTSLVIVLHGGSGSADNVQGFTRMNQVSNEHNFLVVYPQGYAPTAIGGFSWADGRGTPADDMNIDDIGFIDKMIDELILDYPINQDKIYISGFSNGGFMTQRLACEMNDRFAAMASLGSTQDEILSANCRPERPIPMIIIIGTDDPSVPYNGGPMENIEPDVISASGLLSFWSTNNDCQTELSSINLPDINTTDNSTVTVFEFTNCECEANVKHYRINGGGHTWPGVEIESLEASAGETNEDINAGQELWGFFNQYDLCNKTVTSIEETGRINDWHVYPNPTSDMIIIQSNKVIYNLQLLDLSGNLIEKTSPNSMRYEYALGHLAAGTYILKIGTGDDNGTGSFDRIVKR
ncbi:MAG: PHB depolymerase family esterase [Cyclobacteriaceae bacterium]